jgi:hypothetical protein
MHMCADSGTVCAVPGVESSGLLSVTLFCRQMRLKGRTGLGSGCSADEVEEEEEEQ